MSNLLVPIILIISSVGLFFTYLSPGYETLKAFEFQESRLDDALQQFQKVLLKKEELTRQYVSFLQSDLDGVKLIVPGKIDTVQTIITLDKLAQDNKLFVESFGVPSTEQKSNGRTVSSGETNEYGIATFRITLIGSYENVKKFLYQAERSIALMDVAEFIVEVDEEAEQANSYTFSIALNTYWLY